MSAGQNPVLWRIWLECGADAVTAMEDALAPIAQSVTRFEERSRSGTEQPRWRVQAICDGEPPVAEVALRLAAAAGAAQVEMPDFHVRPLGDRDWLAINRRQFPPVRAGRFFIHGSHFDGPVPADAVALTLDAGPAFGSGTHETTRGCLIAIDEVLSEVLPANPLDLGCGSGILAIAIAAATGAAVTAGDVDAGAVEVTRANAIANGVGDLVQGFVGEGLDAVAARGPFDLIVANILAEPLKALAGAMAAALAPGGRLILSGLLARQENEVVAAYRALGLTRVRSIVLGDWTTLVLSRPAAG